SNLLQGPDPRFGMQAPLPKSLTITAGGLTSTLTTQRVVTLSDANNSLSLTGLTDTVTLNGHTGTNVYDAATKTFTATSPANRKRTTTIDTLGRLTQAQVGSLLAINTTYDLKGRPASVTQGTGTEARTVTFSYNSQGYRDTVTDPLGQQVRYTYDAVGRITQKTLPDFGAISFAYDANGNLTSVALPGGSTHVLHYTVNDLTADYVPPDVGAGDNSTLYTYDLDKVLTSIARPDGQTVTFDYDSLGRLTAFHSGVLLDSYSYDATTGKLTGITTGDGQALRYTYTGALLTTVNWTGAVTGSMGASYDNDYRVTSLTVNGATPITFRYDDPDGLLTVAGS